MFEKPFYMFKDLIRILIAYFPPDLYKRMLSISIREHKYPNAFKGTNHFDTSRFALWDFTCEEIGRDSKITYLDFGVWNGRSIKYFSENFIVGQKHQSAVCLHLSQSQFDPLYPPSLNNFLISS